MDDDWFLRLLTRLAAAYACAAVVVAALAALAHALAWLPWARRAAGDPMTRKETTL